MVICPDTRTSVLLKLEAFDLSDNGYKAKLEDFKASLSSEERETLQIYRLLSFLLHKPAFCSMMASAVEAS
jgi:hypothetical protein